MGLLGALLAHRSGQTYEQLVKTRILSAIVALAIVLPVLAFGGPMGVAWLMFPLILIGMDEYVKMALPGVSRVEWALMLAGGGLVAAVAVHKAAYLGAVIPLVVMASLVVPMFREDDVARAAQHAVERLHQHDDEPDQ